jgi:pimeloyl-ACP methyl ester carboxylesterase
MKTIVFIHGMFQNNKSWAKWINYFEQLGYTCIAPAWPLHEGEPKALRESPPAGLGDLRLDEVIMKMTDIVSGLDERPIVIGHSVGGLITQILANRNLVSMGIPIASVAPNRMLSLNWDFFKNSVEITNPFKGDEPMYTDLKSFHASFCNTLDADAAAAAFEETATHDSRNILRDCMLSAGEVDLELPHAPLLFIGGEEDKIVPCQLVEKNSKAYKDKASITAYKQFRNRSHYICGEPKWDEVADYVAEWVGQYVNANEEEIQPQDKILTRPGRAL